MRGVLVTAVLMAFAHDPSCGGVDTTTGGVNAPCTRDKDCGAGLTCASGVCESPDASTPDAAGESGAGDAGSSDGADEDHG